MKWLFLPPLLLPHHSPAQASQNMLEKFAIVLDRDSYTNIRKDTGLGSTVVDTLHNGHFVYCFDFSGRWISIAYSTKKADQSNAWVFHNRVRLVNDYENIPRISKDKYRFGKDSLKVEVGTQPFVKSRYRLRYAKEGGYVESINGKKFWGTDGEMPKRAYKSITINMGAKEISLPAAAIEF